MEENVFEVGDVLEIKSAYVRIVENIEKIDRGLVVRSFVDENENAESTRCYVVLFIPAKFYDDADFIRKTLYKTSIRVMTEEFLIKNSKKIDHVDLTPFVA